MNLELWLHNPTGNRYIVLSIDGVAQQAAGPLSNHEIKMAQENEWSIPWMPGLGNWVQAHRDEFETVFPQARSKHGTD